MPENTDTLCGGIGSEHYHDVDPAGRLDIAASRVIERLVPRIAERCKMPELVMLYAGFQPHIDLLLTGLLGPKPERNGGRSKRRAGNRKPKRVTKRRAKLCK